MASFTCLSRNFDQRFTSFLRELGRLSCLLVVGGQVELDAVGPTPHYPHRYRLREKQLRRALLLYQARGPPQHVGPSVSPPYLHCWVAAAQNLHSDV